MKRLLAITSLLLLANYNVAAQAEASFAACSQVRTTFLTVGGHGGIAGVTSCNTPGCSASGTLGPSWNVTCPGAAGGVCTFSLQPSFNYSTSPNALALLYPTVAGKIGPLLNDNDDFVLPHGSGVASFTFVEQVQNTSANQTHKVQMWLQCFDNGDGYCYASAGGFSMYTRALTVRIDVFTGCYESTN